MLRAVIWATIPPAQPHQSFTHKPTMITAAVRWITSKDISATLETEAAYGDTVDVHEWRIACLRADNLAIRKGPMHENESAAIGLNCEAIKFHMQALADS